MMKKGDLFLIAAILMIGIITFGVFSFRASGKEAVVYQNGKETMRFALSEDVTVTLTNGENSENEMVIENYKVSVHWADCPDQICVKQGEISKEGETIVCLPHKLVIKIQ